MEFTLTEAAWWEYFWRSCGVQQVVSGSQAVADVKEAGYRAVQGARVSTDDSYVTAQVWSWAAESAHDVGVGAMWGRREPEVCPE